MRAIRKTAAVIVFAAAAACTAATVSCTGSEPESVLADIVSCTFPKDILKTSPIITNTEVIALVIPGSDLTRITPTFRVSPGARITPASGTALNFEESPSHEFTVTSENGKWHKKYTVSAIDANMPTEFGFENWERKSGYMVPFEFPDVDPQDEAYEKKKSVKMPIWSSGNAGFALTGMADDAGDYPTAPTEEARTGRYAAKLVTSSTGSFGAMAKKRLAAGNLFIGTFDGSKATSEPLQATRFGIPFNGEPLRFEGYYKYKAGEKFQDANGHIIPGRTDQCTVYAIFYERGAIGDGMLNGSNALSSPQLVAVAKSDEMPQTDQWTKFSIDFVYENPATGEPTVIDPAKLSGFKYNIGVVFSSSDKGAEFSGAVGSTLLVDDVSIICK